MDFKQKIEKQWSEKKFLCVGLDPEIEKIPQHITGAITEKIVSFNTALIDATAEYVCAFKPNSAFYEAYGTDGIQALKQTCDYITRMYPDIVLLLDAKRGDIGSTNNGYVKYAFDYLVADAITVHPYLGEESLKAFLERKDKGIFILVRTSNPGAGELQDLSVSGKKLFETITNNIQKTWNKNGNCGVVAGATYPEELQTVRKIVGSMPILIPGIGAQGGDLTTSVTAGKTDENTGILISSSRGIIYASSGTDFAEKAGEEAKKVHDQIHTIIYG